MLPRVGSRNLVSRLKQVVLPAPFGPINAWIEPRRTFRSTPLTAVKPLNSFVRPRASRMVGEVSVTGSCPLEMKEGQGNWRAEESGKPAQGGFSRAAQRRSEGPGQGLESDPYRADHR